ncbi:hypothetical protein RKD19_001496 [Streptomyces canus]|uniref:hypothetical protein n=1 Tax=unclassified Streptomyces TaxID=2593676 RepID=UPI000F64C3D2|nr:hypothetical protein [Streptomyces sp. RP5T]RRR83648.1 hypothetical protein EHS43_13845 [Streptomyces sp. RP5T]
MTDATNKSSAEEELAQQVMPTILELQRVLVEGSRNALGTGSERMAGIVSLTSCTSHSCHGVAER